jgi:hypothetical protein
MPIISVEGLVPWTVALFFIHRIIKKFKAEENMKIVILNAFLCGSIILIYNILGTWIETILVNLWM